MASKHLHAWTSACVALMTLLVVIVDPSGCSEAQPNHLGQDITSHRHLSFLNKENIPFHNMQETAQAKQTKSSDKTGRALEKKHITDAIDGAVLATTAPLLQLDKTYRCERGDDDYVSEKVMPRVMAIPPNNFPVPGDKPDPWRSSAQRHLSYDLPHTDDKQDSINAEKIDRPRCYVQNALGVTVGGAACRATEGGSGCPVFTDLLPPKLLQGSNNTAYFTITKRIATTKTNHAEDLQRHKSNPLPAATEMTHDLGREVTGKVRPATQGQEEVSSASSGTGQPEGREAHRVGLSLTVVLPETVVEDVMVWISTSHTELDYPDELKSEKTHRTILPIEINRRPSKNGKESAHSRKVKTQVEAADPRKGNAAKLTLKRNMLPGRKQVAGETIAEALEMNEINLRGVSNSSSPVTSDSDWSGRPSCWGFLFRCSSGWPGSVLQVHSLPYFAARYTAYVTLADNTTVLAYSSFDVTAGLPEDLPNPTQQSQHLGFRAVPSPLRPNNPLYSPLNSPLHYAATVFRRNDISENDDVVTPGSDVSAAPRPKGISVRSPVEPYLIPGSLPTLVQSQSSFGLGDLADDFSQVQVRSKRDIGCPSCLQKVSPRHEYNPATAVFTLTLSFNCSPGCCQECQAQVNIMQYRYDVNNSTCSGLRKDPASMSVLSQVLEAGSVSVRTPYHIELPTGCYIAKLLISGSQLFYGFMWLKPLREPTDLNTWNTTFYLDPRPSLKEVEVRWTESRYPFNFSRYSLQLWYQENKTLNCSGYHDRSDHLLQVQPTPSLPLDEPQGVFVDLAPGWYCARVTPHDARCPRDGCAVRASHSVKLEAYSPPFDVKATANTETDGGSGFSITLLAVGLTLVVCVLGLGAAFGVWRRLADRQNTHTLDTKGMYRQVRPNAASKGTHRPVLLLAWTPLGDTHGRTATAVHALKRALGPHFSVYDYLDLLSLPVAERELLLQSPAGWLHATLHKPSIKVVLVSTPGAARWQRTVRGEQPVPPPGEGTTPLDSLLFPSLLQQIHQSPYLMADYSKIFVVRFTSQATVSSSPASEPGVTSEESGLEGVVQGLLYSLPMHLHALLLALTGLPNDSPEGAALLPYNCDLIDEMVSASTGATTSSNASVRGSKPPGGQDNHCAPVTGRSNSDTHSVTLQDSCTIMPPPDGATSKNNVQNAKYHHELVVNLNGNSATDISSSNCNNSEEAIVGIP